MGDPEGKILFPDDEWYPLSINYTSGTTGRPKGVVANYRGAYLLSYSNAICGGLRLHDTYLPIVPLFHANCWCLPWTTMMLGGSAITLRTITSKGIFDRIADHKVNFMNGAPIILNMLGTAKDEEKRKFDHEVKIFTAG